MEAQATGGLPGLTQLTPGHPEGLKGFTDSPLLFLLSPSCPAGKGDLEEVGRGLNLREAGKEAGGGF